MSNIPKARQLPDKESKLFKELLTQYELKGYKKGIKAADTILKKFPNHGETIALKALTIHSSLPYPATVSSVPKAEEAEAMARLAVKKDITSHITWHVLGIIAKTKKDWEEAGRAFAMARKQDPDNIPLIRDSIALYLHNRQYDQAAAARHHHLLLRPQLRTSWLGTLVAHHLNNDPDEALAVYDGYQNSTNVDGGSAPEKAQTLLYIISICIESGKYEDGLRRLEDGLRDGVINARGDATVMKAELLTKLGRTQEAEDTYRALLEQNPDNLSFYRGFLSTKGYDITKPIDSDAEVKVLSSLDSLAELYPRSSPPRRLALDIATGEEFRKRVRAYLVAGLERGVPSLFVDVKGVYRDASKQVIVGEILEEVIAKLEKDTSLHGDDTVAPPTSLLWAYYFYALHLAHPLHPNPSYQRALDYLEKANEHTPTLPEVYMAQAKVLKRAGDPLGAAQKMEEARLLDGQDRFLNGKAAKYWLRAGEVKKAEELVSMFTKKEMTAVADLTDLQCLWFLQEEGDAHARNGELALALKRFQGVVASFQEYDDDQYDFHTYCMRRMTLIAYIALMRFEDQLRSHPAYFHAANASIDIYIRIHDNPDLTVEKISPEEEAERKKAAKKAQKAEQKAKKAAAASGEKKEDPIVPDDDPDGKKLLTTETPLDDAIKLWRPLEKLASGRIEVQVAGAELFVRKGLFLAALKHLLAAKEIDAEDSKLHSAILNFRRSFAAAEDVPEAVKTVVDEAFPSLILNSTTSEDFNATFLADHSTSPAHILGAAAGLLEIKRASEPLPSDTAESVSAILTKLTTEGVPPSIPVFLQAVQLLKDAGASESQVADFETKVKARVPLAEIFASPEEKKKQRDAIFAVDKEA